jgi:hypothetical protein
LHGDVGVGRGARVIALVTFFHAFFVVVLLLWIVRNDRKRLHNCNRIGAQEQQATDEKEEANIGRAHFFSTSPRNRRFLKKQKSSPLFSWRQNEKEKDIETTPLWDKFEALFKAAVLYYKQSWNYLAPLQHGLSCIVDVQKDAYDTQQCWKTLAFTTF